MDESGSFAPEPAPRREVRVGLSAAMDDPTAEARWRRAGRLLSGLAHDFKNPLAVVQGYGQLLLERTPADSEDHADMECLLAEVTRVVALVDDLQAYARRDADLPASFDVRAGVDSALGLARVRVDVQLPPAVAVVRAPRAASLHSLVTLLCVAADELSGAEPATRVLRVHGSADPTAFAVEVRWTACRERLAPTGLGELQGCAEALRRHGAQLRLPAFALEPGQVRLARLLWPAAAAGQDDDIIG